MKKLLLFLWVSVLMASCTVQTSYIGKSYPATGAKPELFFNWADIPSAYETMGHINATPQMFGTLEKAQAAIEKRACEAGADAVIFEGVSQNISNPSMTATEKTDSSIDGSQTKTTTITNSVQTINTLRATLIKYKKNNN